MEISYSLLDDILKSNKDSDFIEGIEKLSYGNDQKELNRHKQLETIEPITNSVRRKIRIVSEGKYIND